MTKLFLSFFSTFTFFRKVFSFSGTPVLGLRVVLWCIRFSICWLIGVADVKGLEVKCTMEINSLMGIKFAIRFGAGGLGCYGLSGSWDFGWWMTIFVVG